MRWFFLFSSFSAVLGNLIENESCRTVFNTVGVCKVDRDCSFFVNISKRNSSIARSMTENRCGFSENSVIVCCPVKARASEKIEENQDASMINEKCVFHEDIEGTCKLDVDCLPFKTFPVIRKQLNFSIVIKRCGFHGASMIVCCPSSDDFRQVFQLQLKRKSEKACEKFGPQKLDFSSRIIGGDVADDDEFPQFASLGTKYHTGEIVFNCGGALISEKFVLTAAHCCSNSSLSKPYVFRLGKNSVSGSEDRRWDYRIKTVTIHPQYKINNSKYNDIAVAELYRSVTFTTKIWPACLIQQETLLDIPLTIAGYGRTSIKDSNQRAEKLLKAMVYEVDLEECRKSYASVLSGTKKNVYRLPSGIEDTQLCAKSRGSHADTCQGDSGTALFTSFNKTFYVAGITSFGLSCNSTLPAFYTRVFKYLTWIENIVWPD